MSNQNGKIKVCSLFSGIGGFELGIIEAIGERANFVAYSEIDKYAVQIYKKQFNHKNYGDITKIIAKELPDFDLVVGGFPCQSFSIAGKRLGFKDTRGTLFFDIARIIKEKKPKYLLLENVKGLLSHDSGRTFRTILSTLNELGYDIQWQVLNSKNFGVPQNRERVFIVGNIRGEPRPKVFPIGETDKTIDRYKSIPKVIARGGLQNHAGEIIEQSPALTEAMGKGGGQTPIIKQLNNPTHSNNRVYSEEGLSPTLNTAQGGNRQPFIKSILRGRPKYKDGKRGLKYYEYKKTCPTLTENCASGDQKNIVKSVLTPDRINKRQNGRRIKEDGEPSFTLTGQDRHGVMIVDKKGNSKKKDYASTLSGGGHSGGNHSDMDLLKKDTKIRRLTPTECERLQGFPDGWTKYGIDEKGEQIEISDTQKYKTLGNAVSCPVIKAIIERLLMK